MRSVLSLSPHLFKLNSSAHSIFARQHVSAGTVPFTWLLPTIHDRDRRRNDDGKRLYKRNYHSTARKDILAAVSAIVVSGIGYALYQKCRGKKIMPDDYEQAKESFRKLKVQRESMQTAGETANHHGEKRLHHQSDETIGDNGYR